MRPDRFIVQLIVTAVFVVYLAWMLIQGQRLTGVVDLWGVGVSVVWIAWVIFDRWGWRWPVLRLATGGRPDIRGTWRGSLAPEYSDQTGTPGRADPEVYLVIHETFSTLSARLFTRESKSETIVGSIHKSDGGGSSLVGVYRNVPRSSVILRSPIHHGALILDIEGSPPATLDGRYWTERGGRGELRLTVHVPRLVGSHEQGHRLVWQDELA